MFPSGCANALAVGSLHRHEHTEAASMDEHGGHERTEGANGCRQFHDNPHKLRRRESAGQDWAGLGIARGRQSGDQRTVERCMRGARFTFHGSFAGRAGGSSSLTLVSSTTCSPLDP